MTLRLGTRGSKLALWQAHHVKSLLQNLNVDVDIKTLVTEGDRVLDRPLAELGGKGLFLKEIEEALLAHEIDFAVHSLKDVPHTLPDGLSLVAVLKREDAFDAFVSRDGTRIRNLPAGSRVATSSLRRQVQLRLLYPHLDFVSLRGNVDTRLKKLETENYAGLVLASAGLIRLGLQSRITENLPIVAAVGQGAIALECRSDDSGTCSILQKLHHAETGFCVELEREFLRCVQGSCQTPLGCHVRKLGTADLWQIEVFTAEVDGSSAHHDSHQNTWQGVSDWIREKFSR